MAQKQIGTFISTSALLGTIIGAGFLGIPYMVMQSGFTLGLINLIFIALVVTITMLYLGEVALRTKENCHLSGYAEKYIGKKGKKIMFFSVAFGVYSAIVAYLIAEGESLSQIFFGNQNYAILMSLLFWFFLSIISYYGLIFLKKVEPIGIILLFILIISISILFFGKTNIENLNYVNWGNIFMPFGVILFAFLGFTAIPEIKIILGENKRFMKKTIIQAYSLSLITYIVFTFFVLGHNGKATPELATISLGTPFILLGIVTIFNSYLALTNSAIDTLKFDFNWKKASAWILAISIPIVLFSFLQITNSASFTLILSIGGVISGGLTGILILIMAKNAKLLGDRNPEYSMPYSNWIFYLLSAIYVAGAIFEIFYLCQ